mmetsp:Transcript_14746/g.51687  ORF Transcript_14746/g.51687 Transcript_14746/m.51687 type:complete len:281 (-) Transcript_14746:32-874(-)
MVCPTTIRLAPTSSNTCSTFAILAERLVQRPAHNRIPTLGVESGPQWAAIAHELPRRQGRGLCQGLITGVAVRLQEGVRCNRHRHAVVDVLQGVMALQELQRQTCMREENVVHLGHCGEGAYPTAEPTVLSPSLFPRRGTSEIRVIPIADIPQVFLNVHELVVAQQVDHLAARGLRLLLEALEQQVQLLAVVPSVDHVASLDQRCRAADPQRMLLVVQPRRIDEARVLQDQDAPLEVAMQIRHRDRPSQGRGQPSPDATEQKRQMSSRRPDHHMRGGHAK